MATGKKKKAKPWPNSVAAKVLASYIRLKFDISAADLMFFNPPMGAMPFFNNSASPDIRRAELALFGGRFLGFLDDIGVPLEEDMTREDALEELVIAMADEKAPSSGMVAVIDEHYRFVDEEADA
jgi:hypothetical protein